MFTKNQTTATVVFGILALAIFPAVSSAQGSGTVNINSADAVTLELLPRIGPAIAARILEFREQNGQFKTAEDLMLVKGIGEKTYELIAPYITLSGESSLNEKVTVPRSSQSEHQE